jgi:small nuclear ribonucleoprotein (snRNP)-like protein
MRKILMIPALLTVLVLGAAQVFAQTVTVVTRSGQRVRGQLMDLGNSSYDTGNRGSYGGPSNGGDVTVRINGRDSRIPILDVMMIDFAGNGNVQQNELARAGQNPDGMIVLRNGQNVSGTLVGMQPNSSHVLVANNSGQYDLALNQIARIYFGGGNGYSGNGQAGPNNNGYEPYANNRNGNGQYGNNGNGQYGNNGNGGQYGDWNTGQYDGNPARYGGNPAQSGQPSYGNSTNRTITIPANKLWSNSGTDVRRGQVIHFRASGNIALSKNPGDNGTPAGANDRRMAGNSPLPGVTGGMLIGRVNNGQPFAIGAQADITMLGDGRLYLGINDDYPGDNSGNFVVQMSIQ